MKSLALSNLIKEDSYLIVGINHDMHLLVGPLNSGAISMTLSTMNSGYDIGVFQNIKDKFESVGFNVSKIFQCATGCAISIFHYDRDIAVQSLVNLIQSGVFGSEDLITFHPAKPTSGIRQYVKFDGI